MITELHETIGLEHLLAVHANDSKLPCGAGVDRDDKIGEGFIGQEGFAAIMSNYAFKDGPFSREVPGFEAKGPDERNMQILKNIRTKLGVTR